MLKYIGIRCRDVSDSEEETYSTMFTSLKHPARRKILRMLGEKPKSFSMILEELGISSSHLTYHLENLGELVTKMDDGRYKLSTFGRAAVLTMKGVEEAPEIQSKHPLPTRWKTVFSALMIVVIILASLSYVQYNSLNQISEEQKNLKSDLTQLEAQNDILRSWSRNTDGAIAFITDVIQLDITKYHAELVSNTLEFRPDLGGITEEILKYSLLSYESRLDISLRFRNQTLSSYYIQVLEGIPYYSQPQPDNLLDITSQILNRYKTYAGASYLNEMESMLDNVTNIAGLEKVVGNMKLEATIEGNSKIIKWVYTVDGIDFPTKGVQFKFEGDFLKEITDGWLLYQVGSTKLNVSEEEAIDIALEFAKTISWTSGTQQVKNLTILEDSVEALFWPHPREALELIPYWYVVVHLDRIYPGNIDRIGIGVWGDTGEISSYQTISVG
jgi:DNA-binding transcriptional ArsR family regulator